jgi:hypothetical protein
LSRADGVATGQADTQDGHDLGKAAIGISASHQTIKLPIDIASETLNRRTNANGLDNLSKLTGGQSPQTQSQNGNHAYTENGSRRNALHHMFSDV